MKTPNRTKPNTPKWDTAKYKDLILSGMMLVLMVVLQSNANALSDETYSTLDEVSTGALVARTEQGYAGLIRLGSDIDLNVSGMLVHASIKQEFQNDSKDWVEATYVFPLPSDSAVNTMKIKIGERVIEGIIKEKQQARKIFIEAKRQGKQTGLLEQQRPNLFTTRVANIAPGETVVVDFSYLQELSYSDGEFSVRVPLTLTPRYIPGNSKSNQGGPADDDFVGMPALDVVSVAGWSFPTDQVEDAHEITPPQMAAISPSSASHQASIDIQLLPGFDLAEVTSPYHDIRTQRQNSAYVISPKHNPVLMNRDFVLAWKPVAQQQPTAAVFKESKYLDSSENRGEHLLMMLMPPQQLNSDVVPPRELIIIVDTSGSMAGESIKQAKKAVLMALDKLRPSDQFNVIEFNSSHRVLFPQSKMASANALSTARRFVQGLNASGGTEMYGALNAALNFSNDEQFLRQVVFITDGSVGNEASLFQLIHQSLGDSRLYTVGIGSAPNEFFMRKAAEFGKGTFSLIGSEQEVHQKMAQLFGKIEKPVMTNLKVSSPGTEAEIFPLNIPDLYQGEPLLVNARFGSWPNELLVEGEFNGQPWAQRLSLQSQARAEGVATLWARKKVQSLEDEGIAKGQRDIHKDLIVQLGLDYSIVTRFTSFVAVAKQVVRPLTEGLNSKAVPNLMPSGSNQPPPSVGMPSTALGVHQMMLIGLLSGLLGLMLWVLKYACHFSAIGCASERAKS